MVVSWTTSVQEPETGGLTKKMIDSKLFINHDRNKSPPKAVLRNIHKVLRWSKCGGIKVLKTYLRRSLEAPCHSYRPPGSPHTSCPLPPGPAQTNPNVVFALLNFYLFIIALLWGRSLDRWTSPSKGFRRKEDHRCNITWKYHSKANKQAFHKRYFVTQTKVIGSLSSSIFITRNQYDRYALITFCTHLNNVQWTYHFHNLTA